MRNRLISFVCTAAAVTVANGSWVDRTTDAELTDVTNRLLAFGDFNADRRTDMFVLDGNSVLVYLAKEATFVRSDAACVVQVCLSTSTLI